MVGPNTGFFLPSTPHLTQRCGATNFVRILSASPHLATALSIGQPHCHGCSRKKSSTRCGQRPLSNEVVRNALRFLLQCRIRVGCVGENRLVVTRDVCRPLHRNTHHTQLVTQATKVFTALLHRGELRPKRRRLHRVLLLTPQ